MLGVHEVPNALTYKPLWDIRQGTRVRLTDNERDEFEVGPRVGSKVRLRHCELGTHRMIDRHECVEILSRADWLVA